MHLRAEAGQLRVWTRSRRPDGAATVVCSPSSGHSRLVLLQACVNGNRMPADHPALPITAADLAAEAISVVAIGADALHLHVKHDDGTDTLDADTLARVLTAVRKAAPDLEVGVTTGAWAEPDPARRVAALQSWTELPDVASVNWHEKGAEDVAATLLERGVGVEAGLWHAEAVEAWLASPLRDWCRRVLLELPDGLDGLTTESEARRLLGLLHTGPGSQVPVLLHGEGSSTWATLACAARWGLATRIGLEDTLVLPDGTTAPGNAALVTAARARVRGGAR